MMCLEFSVLSWTADPIILCLNIDNDLWKEDSSKPAERNSQSVHDYYDQLGKLDTWVLFDVEL